MSADNWAVCPRCKKKAESAKDSKHAATMEAYGKVPADQWRKMYQETFEDIELEPTLREDYEIHMSEDGEFFVSYSGRCTACDFVHKFRHEDKVS